MNRIFGHYIPKNLTALAMVEFIVGFAAFYIALEIRFSQKELFGDLTESLNLKAFVFACTIFIGHVAVGLYSRAMREDFTSVLVKLILGLVLAFFLLVTIYYLLPSLAVGRGVSAIAMMMALVGYLIVRSFYSSIADTKLMTSRVLVLGTGKIAKQLELLKRKSDWRGVNLVGFLHLKGDKDEVSEEKIIHSELPLDKMIADYGIDEIIVAVEEHRKNYPVDEIIDCKMKGLVVTEISDFFERRSGRLEIDTLHPNRFIFIEGFSQDSLKILTKRLVDVLFGLVIGCLTLPVYPILVLLIKRESGWKAPVFYSQTRVGQDEENFTIYKFRSMVENAEQQGAQWAAKDDNRVTKIGKIMRKTRLDELPQLWNVIKGDMSFVGPRPERPEFVENLSVKIPYYRMRHRVKPGITGWAQVCYPYGDDEKDAKAKLQYDLYYIKNYSVFLDLTILAQTAQVIMWQKGAR